jgi:GTP pyrophosphokinase/guanosine-3',5'-bis(diphosphate) 3'-pyrophosphohydrolase
MLSAEGLAEQVAQYNPKSNSKLIMQAYAYGRMKHEGQLRKSGEPYFTHPVAVAEILAGQRLDDASIVTALLHDTVEDTGSTLQDISDRFTPEVAKLVDGVTKLTNMQLSSTETKEAENIRKLLMAIAQDMRVILVKLADRLHNMRTIRAMRPAKQVQKARETMDIFAPLAGRMGMQSIREDLEDLSFKVLNAKGRSSIMRRFIKLQKETGDVVLRITGDMNHELDKANISTQVFGRAKKPYSIWRKMQEKDLAFSRLSDIYGFGSSPRVKPIVIACWELSINAGGPCRVDLKIILANQNPMGIGRFIPPFPAETVSALKCKSAPSKCMMLRKAAWRPIGLIGMACAVKTHSPWIPFNGLTR